VEPAPAAEESPAVEPAVVEVETHEPAVEPAPAAEESPAAEAGSED
jgi:hypothetical protein